MPKKKFYVVTAPDSARGIYETWDECKAAVSGVAGARYQSVASREAAEAAMAGEIRRLQPGIYAFVDGNHNGGVGIVIVVQRQDGRSIKEISTTVWQVFADAGLNMLASKAAITEALARIRNILGELAALYGAIGEVDESSEVTIVHDYKGLDAWITGKWRINDPVVAEVVAACRQKIEERGLQVKFLHQPAHQSTFAIADEFVKFNSIADKLATRAADPAEVRMREE